MDKDVEVKAEKMARICKVLGNVKASMIVILLKRSMYISELANELDLSLSRTSRLVDSLEKIGLVKTEYKVFIGKKGVYKFVNLNVNGLHIKF